MPPGPILWAADVGIMFSTRPSVCACVCACVPVIWPSCRRLLVFLWFACMYEEIVITASDTDSKPRWWWWWWWWWWLNVWLFKCLLVVNRSRRVTSARCSKLESVTMAKAPLQDGFLIRYFFFSCLYVLRLKMSPNPDLARLHGWHFSLDRCLILGILQLNLLRDDVWKRACCL